MPEGIRKRHMRDCPARRGKRCNCDGGFEASVYSPRDRKKLYKSFPRESEARSWQAAAKREIDRGALRASNGRTLNKAAAAWLAAAERGQIRNRSGHVYKPATLRGYRASLAERILPELGGAKLSAITTMDIQELVDRWQAQGNAPSTIRNALKPLQVIYRRARAREGIALNPTHDLELPAPNPAEVQIVAPAVAASLLDALAPSDRAIWATALYAGLRYGELRALRWAVLDFSSRTSRVRESWDPLEGSITPKTRTSIRTAPMPEALSQAFDGLRSQHPDTPEDALVFADRRGHPFHAASLYRRADRAWAAGGIEAKLRLHQARHTYASFMIAAGVNAKGALGLHGPLLDQGHVRPLRAPDARQRGRGGAARPLSRWRQGQVAVASRARPDGRRISVA